MGAGPVPRVASWGGRGAVSKVSYCPDKRISCMGRPYRPGTDSNQHQDLQKKLCPYEKSYSGRLQDWQVDTGLAPLAGDANLAVRFHSSLARQLRASVAKGW